MRLRLTGSVLQQKAVTYSHKKVVNFCIVYEIDDFQNIDNYPTLRNAQFGAVTLTKNAHIDKHRYFEYGIGFDGHRSYSHPSSGNGRNLIIIGVGMSLSIKTDNKKKDILIFGLGPTPGLGEHSLSVEKIYSINFTKINTKFCLSLYYNGANSYLFLNGTEIRKLTAKDSEIVPNNLSLGNVSKNSSASNMKKTAFIGHIYDFHVDYDAIDVDDILVIHNYLIK